LEPTERKNLHYQRQLIKNNNRKEHNAHGKIHGEEIKNNQAVPLPGGRKTTERDSTRSQRKGALRRAFQNRKSGCVPRENRGQVCLGEKDKNGEVFTTNTREERLKKDTGGRTKGIVKQQKTYF